MNIERLFSTLTLCALQSEACCQPPPRGEPEKEREAKATRPKAPGGVVGSQEKDICYLVGKFSGEKVQLVSSPTSIISNVSVIMRSRVIPHKMPSKNCYLPSQQSSEIAINISILQMGISKFRKNKSLATVVIPVRGESHLDCPVPLSSVLSDYHSCLYGLSLDFFLQCSQASQIKYTPNWTTDYSSKYFLSLNFCLKSLGLIFNILFSLFPKPSPSPSHSNFTSKTPFLLLLAPLSGLSAPEIYLLNACWSRMCPCEVS